MSEPSVLAGSFYVAGGTLRAGTPSYVERRADSELHERLLAGDFCYVLTARQMGKSSLMASTAKRLEATGVRTAIVDLTQIGTERGAMTAESWYYGVAYEIHRRLEIAEPLRHWWQDREGLPALQRLTRFLRDLVLEICPGRIVIFVDEIDSTIGLSFADDFFAAIRSCHNARATDSAFERLTFVLLGVASPDQLIRDPARTPFNVGRQIDLTDFTPEEARLLAKGLHADPEVASQRLARIVHWTGGHPYLTQVLCRAVEEKKDDTEAPDTIVDPLVEEIFFTSQGQREETNLKHTRARLARSGAEGRRLLHLYLRVCRGQAVADEPTSYLCAQLKLSGVLKVSNEGLLTIRNRIYETIFTAEWAKSEIPPDRGRRLAAAVLAAALLLTGLWYVSYYLRPVAALQAATDYPAALPAYQRLYGNPLLRSRAAELMAQFWERRAQKEASLGHRDDSLLAWLKAVEANDTPRRRKEAQALVGDDYKELRATFRHADSVNSVSFSPAGRTILTGSSDGTARFWDTSSGQGEGLPLVHGARVSAVAFSADGQRILTGGLPALRFWNVAGKQIYPPFREEGSAVALGPDGRALLGVGSDGKAWVQDTDTGRRVVILFPHSGERDRILCGAFSPDSQRIAMGSDHGAWIWAWKSPQSSLLHLPHPGDVLSAAFSPDGRTVLTGGMDGTTRLWDKETRRTIAILRQGSPVASAAFSPDGRLVLTGSEDGTARLWDKETGRPLGPGLRQEKGIRSVAFSPGTETVLTGGRDGSARLWNRRTELPKEPPLQPGVARYANGLTPDEKMALESSEEDPARVQKPAVQPAARLSPEAGASSEDVVLATASSPDHKSFFSARAHWLDIYAVNGKNRILQASRYLRGTWKGGFRFPKDCGRCVQVILGYTDSFFFETIRFDEPDEPPIQGDPKKLLTQWQKLLALRFDDKMNIVPQWQEPETSRKGGLREDHDTPKGQ